MRVVTIISAVIMMVFLFFIMSEFNIFLVFLQRWVELYYRLYQGILV